MKHVTTCLEIAAAENPTNPAIVHKGVLLSYRELAALADGVTSGLERAGVASGDRVAVLMAKSEAAVACIYGVLGLSCSYVPIDPNTPAQRIFELLHLCGVRWVVVDTDHRAPMGESMTAGLVKVLPYASLLAPGCSSADRPRRAPVAGAHEAAVLPTSGSTGQPKGVAISHENLAHFVAWAVSEFHIGPGDRLLSHAPLQFDLSFFDFFAAVAGAACTVLADANDISNPARLCALVKAAGVTIWQSVPSALTALLEGGQRGLEPMPSVRSVLFAGERMPRRTLLNLPGLFPKSRLYNVYGATETNDTFMYRVPEEPSRAPDPLPIGQPLPYVRFRVVDDNDQPVARGEAGHLLVAAPTVMTGYVSNITAPAPRMGPANRTELTEFPTNDLVSMGSDGHLYYHGRRDSVVKTNGYRVNLLQVEDQLKSHPKVDQSVVVALPDAQIGTTLVAVVKLIDGESASSLDFKIHCAQRLPRYAIPHRFEFVQQSLPMSGTGKIDRRRVTLGLSNNRTRVVQEIEQ